MYSVDIFDTLITRKTATPQGIFSIMQELLSTDPRFAAISPFLKKNFYVLRENAEYLARKCLITKDNEDITLHEIYKTMALTGEINDDDVIMLSELEIQTEKDNIEPVKKEIVYVNDLVKKGEHVVLISDMYLPGDVIKEIIRSVDNKLADLNIYVSSDYRKTKGSGNLYKLVKNKEGLEYKEWTHIDDNPRALKKASELGIRTIRCEKKSYFGIEDKIIKQHGKNAYVQKMIGATENIRLNNDLSIVEKIGVSFGGPILYGYVCWLINRSIDLGINRLYFIARDAYVLKIIADEIIKAKKLNLTTYYIFGSRRAWRLPSISEVEDIEELLQMSYFEKVQTVEDVADIFELSESNIFDLLPSISYTGSLTYIQKRVIRNALCKNEKLLQLIVEHQKENRKNVIGYLKASVNVNDEKFAFVELSGTGYTQRCLCKLFKPFYDDEIKTFFYRVENKKNIDNCRFFAFFPGGVRMFSLELLCRAPYDQTIGYMKSEDCFIPVLDTVESDALVKHGINDYIEGVSAFTKKIIEYGNQENDTDLSIVREYIDSFLYSGPNPEVSDFFGDMPYGSTGKEKKLEVLAPKISVEDVRTFIAAKEAHRSTNYDGSLFEYSIYRSDRAVKEEYERLKHPTQKHDEKIVQGIREFEQYLEIDRFSVQGIKGNLILYGAGRCGREYLKTIKKDRNIKLVAWVDKNWEEFDKKYNIKPPNSILDLSFDWILISIENEAIYKQVIENLISMGIEREKIL